MHGGGGEKATRQPRAISQFVNRLGLGQFDGQTVVAVVAVATRAVLREQPRALRFRIVLEQQQRGGLDALGLGQGLHPDCILFMPEDRLEVIGAVWSGEILLLGQVRERTGPAEEHKQHKHVEHVPDVPAADEGHQEQHAKEQGRDVNGAPYLVLSGKEGQLEELEQEQEKPVRPRGGKWLERIRRRTLFRAVNPDKRQHGRHERQTGHDVLEQLVRPTAGVRAERALGWPDAMTAVKPGTRCHGQHHENRQHPGVEGKKPGQRKVTVLHPADGQLLQPRPDERDQCQEIRGDFRGAPKGLLIPRQQIAAQRLGHNKQQQQDAQPIVDLARRLVRTIDHDLHQVQQQQHWHQVRCPVVDAPQQPAAAYLVLDVVDRLPRIAGAGAVAHPQKQSGDHLHKQCERHCAAPDVSPPRAAWDVLVQERPNKPANPGAVLNPTKQRLHDTGIGRPWPD